MRVEDFKDDKEFIANIDKVDTDELFSQLEYYGCDGYYGHLHSAVLEELKKRAKEYKRLKETMEIMKKRYILVEKSPRDNPNDFMMGKVVPDVLQGWKYKEGNE